jgi:hypothetical protein
MKNEQRLLLLAVIKDKTEREQIELNELFNKEINWGYIAGQLYHHRLSGYFYCGLTKEQKKCLYKEFEKTIILLMKAQKKQVLDVINATLPILNDFNKEGVRYAGLKGLVFNAGLYEPGERRSNDSDLLVLEEDLDKLDNIIRRYGYIQSYMPGGELIEASRKEKMIQRINYHDLVPYVKLYESEFTDKLEIDINFHFDSKDNDITGKILETGTVYYENKYYKIKGLPWETHFAHLCIHFHREATDTIWTESKRDITLYKLIDIINTLRLCKNRALLDKWVTLVQNLKIDKACYYTLYHLNYFYNEDENIQYLLPLLKSGNSVSMDDIHITGSGDATMKRKESFYDSAFNFTFLLKKQL